MNRYSLLFAMIVAASFAGPTSHAPGTARPASASGNPTSAHNRRAAAPDDQFGVDSFKDLDEFLRKRVSQPKGSMQSPDVVFATVPHPTETHLAANFDEVVAAVQQGIQDAGYLFDTAWIPWEVPRSYELFDDDGIEKRAIEYQDTFPGILLFRKVLPANSPASPIPDAYGKGLIVFLITEKPTAGIAVPQVDRAIGILKSRHIPLQDDIRIIGPTYSGSSASLGPVVRALYAAHPAAQFRIRSGGVSGGESMKAEIARIAAQFPHTPIDFGSASHDYMDWAFLVQSRLEAMGISDEHIAFLNEDESSYGRIVENRSPTSASSQNNRDVAGSWHIPFPRDISSLRAGYENQGVLDGGVSPQPWKHFLSLKSDEQSEGDTVRSFGGVATIASQEAILLGIAEFLKAHNIRAVVISATNPSDTYFLSQFFHVNNSGIRIVSVGATRLFLRGANAQFRGDLVVDDFPMLPRLYDWTAGGPESGIHWSYTQRVFADGFAQGTYMAAIDLMAPPDFSGNSYRVYPEYSAPDWQSERPSQVPPMYLTTLGSDAPWPMAMQSIEPAANGTLDTCSAEPLLPITLALSSGLWRVAMPYRLFASNCGTVSDKAPRGTHPHIGHLWIALFLFVWATIAAYGACFFYAQPVTRRLCASFQPAATWRYWVFTVTIPAIIAGCALQVLAAPLDVPDAVSSSMNLWWWLATLSSILAPLLISLFACLKARKSDDSAGYAGKYIAVVLPVVFMVYLAFLHRWNFCGRPAPDDLSAILNVYREMHWESGLSLLPTWLIVLFSLFLWTRQASQTTALFQVPPVLPTFPKDQRISRPCSVCAEAIARPLPDYRVARWLWVTWMAGVFAMIVVVMLLPSFRAVTTLENHAATRALLYAATIIASLVLLDICQFLWLWNELRKLLRALDSRTFKRSFVPISDFKWSGLWSFSGVSFSDQRVILSAMVDCIGDLDIAPFFPRIALQATVLANMRATYRTAAHPPSIAQYRADLASVFEIVAQISSEIADQMELREYPLPRAPAFEPSAEQRILASHCDDRSRFSGEADEVARLLDWQQASEKLVCLCYIGFIQTIIARLHGLMLSVASVFSLIALAVAIYPFAPMSPFYLSGFTFLPLLAWAFFHVFSQMDTDPVLSRIVKGDDRKLQWNFYGKFAESLALPVLTLMSSLMPGGTGRILDVVRTLLTHSQ